MNGLEAITAHNGWAISVVGISIVFTGLTLLSLTIAQLHKILDFWDHRETWMERIKQGPQQEEKIPLLKLSADKKTEAGQYKLLIERMEEPFALPKLIDFSEKRGLTSPHSTISDMIRARLIVSDGKGFYRWNR